MKIVSLRNARPLGTTNIINDQIRESFILELNNVELSGRNNYYPNCLIQMCKEKHLLNPYDERVMSLKKDSFYDNDSYDPIEYNRTNKEINPVFFFIYNVDNYYHFIYDTMPYLYGYFKLKLLNPDLKLLINTAHPDKVTFSQFVLEFLKSAGIADSDLLIANKTTKYEKMYIMTSFTHGQKSNEPYSSLSSTIWDKCLTSVCNGPKRFYISRRSWIHGKTDNIGTNYTMRRKCVNEDEVVSMLKKYNVEEIFTELLTTEEKISYFRNAELIVGIVGGGMCNLIFSPKTTKSLCINTPHFLDINSRFQHSMNHTNILYSDCTEHQQKNVKFQLYSRVKIINFENESYGLIGEVEDNSSDIYKVKLSSNDVAGFSQNFSMTTKSFYVSELEAIDPGLNSPFICDIAQLEADLKKIV